jgi:hypothetical protein
LAPQLKEDRERDLIAEIKHNYEMSNTTNSENRRLFSEDLRFAFDSETNGQWDPIVLSQRRGRPSYTFNRVIGAINLVLGDQRQTRPAVKIRASNKAGAQGTADIFGGMFRDIEQVSSAESIYDQQFKYAVAGGWGAWRIVPEYEDDNSFSQVLRIKDIPNPLTVFWDPEAQDPCAGDAMWAIISDRISEEKYEALYPGFKPQNFEVSRDGRGWAMDKEVRIAEYFKKVPYTKKIALMDDGTIIEYTSEQKKIDDHLKETNPNGKYPKPVKFRKVKTWKVVWHLVDGKNILEGPIEYDWKRIPVIRCPGRFVNIEGKQKMQSLIRHSKDSQRAYNYHRSTMIETAALTPRSPYIVTGKMVKGYEDVWATANTTARPYLPYDVDPDAPGQKPMREPPPDVPQALLALAQQDVSDIQASTGYFDPALGEASDSDRASGKALVARQRKSDLGSYEFIDQFGKALKLTVECALDMIPTVYDTERVVRVIGQDGVDKYLTVNGQDASDPEALKNDLKKGAYDVTVTIGPSYQTARQETLATLLDAAATMPIIGEVAPDIIAKNIDVTDGDELVRRLRIPLIQKGLVQPTDEEKKMMPPPQPPDPVAEATKLLAISKASKMSSEATITASKASTTDLEVTKMIDKIIHDRVNALLTAKQFGLDNPAPALASMEGSLRTQVQGSPQGAPQPAPAAPQPQMPSAPPGGMPLG